MVAPEDLATIYDLSALFTAGYSGQGQTIAVVEPSNLYTTSDWNTFRDTFGLTPAYPAGSMVQLHPSGSGANNCADPGTNGADVEATLDAEWASAAAPSATIEVASCFDSTTTPGIFIALENLVNEAAPPAIVSISYISSEAQIGAAGNAFINTLYQQAASEGISIFAGRVIPARRLRTSTRPARHTESVSTAPLQLRTTWPSAGRILIPTQHGA